MKHHKFFATRPLLNSMQSAQTYMVKALKPYKRDLKRSSVYAYKYELELELERLSGKSNRRIPVGFIRAFGHTHYFAGCYVGAEND